MSPRRAYWLTRADRLTVGRLTLPAFLIPRIRARYARKGL